MFSHVTYINHFTIYYIFIIFIVYFIGKSRTRGIYGIWFFLHLPWMDFSVNPKKLPKLFEKRTPIWTERSSQPRDRCYRFRGTIRMHILRLVLASRLPRWARRSPSPRPVSSVARPACPCWRACSCRRPRGPCWAARRRCRRHRRSSRRWSSRYTWVGSAAALAAPSRGSASCCCCRGRTSCCCWAGRGPRTARCPTTPWTTPSTTTTTPTASWCRCSARRPRCRSGSPWPTFRHPATDVRGLLRLPFLVSPTEDRHREALGGGFINPWTERSER